MPEIKITLESFDVTYALSIASQTRAEDLIGSLVDQLHLPPLDEENNEIYYYLERIDNGEVLNYGCPLIDLGIKDGTRIALKANCVPPKPPVEKVNPLNPPADQDGQVTVNLSLPDSINVVQATFDTSQTVETIIRQVVADYKLSAANPKEQYTYRLGSKFTGGILDPQKTLASEQVPSGDTLTIYRKEIPGGIRVMDARTGRLKKEEAELMTYARRSSRGGLVNIEPVNYKSGCPIEEYLVTFTCQGIIGIDADLQPQYGDFHRVRMMLGSDFPAQVPYLKWLTPIWHPNILHLEPHFVCTDKTKNWHPKHSLKDLVEMLGYMVQYRLYHAVWEKPFPADVEVAKWVREYAEPNGIVGPDHPVDTRPLWPPESVRCAPDDPSPGQPSLDEPPELPPQNGGPDAQAIPPMFILELRRISPLPAKYNLASQAQRVENRPELPRQNEEQNAQTPSPMFIIELRRISPPPADASLPPVTTSEASDVVFDDAPAQASPIAEAAESIINEDPALTLPVVKAHSKLWQAWLSFWRNWFNPRPQKQALKQYPEG